MNIGPFFIQEWTPKNDAVLNSLKDAANESRRIYEMANQNMTDRQAVSQLYYKWKRDQEKWVIERVNQYSTNESNHTLVLNLHGATIANLQEWLPNILAQSKRAGFKQVNFIVGIGNHSKGGVPTLLPFLVDYLESSPYEYFAYKGHCIVVFETSGNSLNEIMTQFMNKFIGSV